MSSKKGKGKEKKAADAKATTCNQCGKALPADSVSGFCSSDCEIAYLRGQIEVKDVALAKRQQRKDPVKCLGRVDWETCTQEWYTKDSWDAKRRTAELRKLGFECFAKGIGEMPLLNGNGGEDTMAKVSIVTAMHKIDEKGNVELPPIPEIAEGLSPVSEDANEEAAEA